MSSSNSPLGNAVAPGNPAFAGGTYAPSGNPVSAGGTFTNVGTPGFPAPNIGATAFARNNSGSNVRIPYARLVPMRSSLSTGKDDKKTRGMPHAKNAGQMIQTEYDGLENAELAWIYNRMTISASLAFSGLDRHLNADAVNQSAHGMGLGFGPDRMQRLCFTGFLESYFLHDPKIKDLVIDLKAIKLRPADDNYNTDFARSFLSNVDVPDGASVLNAVDVPFKAMLKANIAMAAPEYGSETAGLPCGIFTMDTGPFLRGKIHDKQLVTFPHPKEPDKKNQVSMERDLGDTLAFDLLYQTMRNKGLFDWTPDGMVLSKLESPTGDTLASSELDARQAQLFNLAIQGPAIAKTWTGDPKLQCLPLDKVFILIVATVATGDFAAGEKGGDAEKANVKTLAKNMSHTVTPEELEAWIDTAAAVHSKEGMVADAIAGCKMFDFKLMRATSSYLLENSFFKNGNDRSRCGLKIGTVGGKPAAEYIVGGWCIGTVLDNAASRSTVGHQVRLAPASMALNINVNIEWWSADKLYRHYMNVEGQIHSRAYKSEEKDKQVFNRVATNSWTRQKEVDLAAPKAKEKEADEADEGQPSDDFESAPLGP